MLSVDSCPFFVRQYCKEYKVMYIRYFDKCHSSCLILRPTSDNDIYAFGNSGCNHHSNNCIITPPAVGEAEF